MNHEKIRVQIPRVHNKRLFSVNYSLKLQYDTLKVGDCRGLATRRS